MNQMDSFLFHSRIASWSGRFLSIRTITWTFLWLLFLLIPSFVSGQQKFKEDLFSVSFPDEIHGWACGHKGTVLYTSDGGKTWALQKSDTDYSLSSIYFADALTGWAVGDNGTIIHTTDGGKTWIKQRSPVSYCLMDVLFVNTQKGWVVTEKTHILYTEDSGKTWTIQFKDQDFILKAISFCDEKTGWAAGEYGYIYHTRDGGKTWEHQAGMFGFSEKTGEIVGGNFLFDVAAVDPVTAWVVGIDGYVAKTEDGGATWHRLTEGIPETHLFGIDVENEQIFIGGKGLLIGSFDGGKNFHQVKVNPPLTYGWVYRIVDNGENKFVAVGSKSCVYLGHCSDESWECVTR